MSPGKRGLALSLAFSISVFWAVYLLPEGLWPWVGLCALIPAGLFLRRGRALGTLICLGVAAALLWCGAYRAVFFSPAEALNGRWAKVTVVLSEQATGSDYGAYVPCWVLQEGRAAVKGTLYGDGALLELTPGDKVTVVCECSKTAFQPQTRFTSLAARGIFLRLTARGPMEVDRAQRIPWWCLPRWWGQRLAASIQNAFPGDVSGLLAAVVTGDRAGLDEGLSRDLTRAGVAHLVAVSGMHVCFLVNLLTLLTGWRPKRRAAVCIPVLILFTLAVGVTPSVMRACLLQISLLAADLLGRESERWTSLSVVLALLLFLDPFSACSVSLQLSFAAVVGIELVTARLQETLGKHKLPGEGPLARLGNGVLRRVWSILATSLGAMALTVPLVAWYFGTLSLLAPLTNLLVLPVVAFLFAGALLTGLLGLGLPGVAAMLGRVLAPLGRYVLWVVRGMSAIPYCAVTLTDIYYPAALVGLYGLFLIAFFWRRERRRVWLFSLCALTLVGGSILLTRSSFHSAQLTAAVLDVGQGQSVVLSSKGSVAVVDCGGSGYDDPGDVCADYLGDRGEWAVDLLILTHYHSDHTNGLDALFDRLDIREVVMPRMEHDEETQIHLLELIFAEGAKLTWLDDDQTVTLGEATLRLYAPLGAGSANEEGLSLTAQAGDFQLLITGDMDTVVERRLVEHAGLGRCQVMVVGHHGSRYASGDALLDAVQPEVAVISVAANNSYGHPAPETLERLEERDMTVYRTDQLGTVTIQLQ